MAIDPRLHETLNDIRRAAGAFTDPWWVMGSAAAMLAGAEIDNVQDVDLLLSARDAEILADRWRDCLLPTPENSDRYRSRPFYRFRRALEVEAMANFEIRRASAWQSVIPHSRKLADGLPIAEPAEQVALLEIFDRPKDRARINALRALT